MVRVQDSAIHGKGVFASRDFKAGEVVLRWDNTRELSPAELQALPPEEKRFTDVKEGKTLHIGIPERFVNHSCAPNTKSGDRCDVALRDIKAGEEITSDYGQVFIASGYFACSCNHAQCRKIIRGTNAVERAERCP